MSKTALTAEQQIERIRVHKGNFEHIAETGDINGNLYADLLTILNEFASQESRKAVEEFKEKLKLYTGASVILREISLNQKAELERLIDMI